ncbi:hypothetical protein [Ornithinimicrobium kibberense]
MPARTRRRRPRAGRRRRGRARRRGWGPHARPSPPWYPSGVTSWIRVRTS